MELFVTYSPLQDAILGVGNDAERGSLGRYSSLQDAFSRIRDDAKWGSFWLFFASVRPYIRTWPEGARTARTDAIGGARPDG